MAEVVCRINVSCYAPGSHNPVRHTLHVLSDGSTDISEHEAEAWSAPLTIMRALGDPGDTNPCIWWHRPSTIRFWDQGHLSVVMGNDEFFGAMYPVADWNIETVGEWTEKAEISVYTSIGVSLPEILTLHPEVKPTDVLDMMKQFPRDGLTGVVPYQVIVPLILGLRHDGETLHEWLATHQGWSSFTAWKSTGYSAQETGTFCRAYETAWLYLHDTFGGAVLNEMVFHPAQALAESLDAAGIRKERAAALVERAPHIIYLEWPGLAEESMPPLPDSVPKDWVAEALATIPNAGFIPGRDRTAWSSHLVHQFPDLFLSHGDPANWPTDWCWPAPDAIAKNISQDAAS